MFYEISITNRKSKHNITVNRFKKYYAPFFVINKTGETAVYLI